MGGRGWSWGKVEGLGVLGIEAGDLSLSFLPGKGFDIDAIVHLPTGTSILSRHAEAPSRLRAFAANGRGSTDYIPWFQGGWQDLLPSRLAIGGVERNIFHTAALESWNIESLEVGPERVVIEATVQLPESGLHLDRRFVIEKARPLLRLDELVENRSNELVEFTWTQHLTFGSDLLGPGVRLLLPSCAQVFDSGGITGRSTDRSTDREGAGEAWNPHSEAPLPEQGSRFLTLDGIKEARVGLENQRRGLGVELRWDLAAMPCLWYWAVKEPAITALGLEPSTTSLPDYGAASAAGMTCRLEPGETKNLWLELELYRTQVWGMRASGSRLQVPRRPNTQYPGDKHGIEA